MKRILCLLIFSGVFWGSATAQGLGEWFNQKKTQTKYLLEQIAALQVYAGYLQKGYNIARTGLNVIGNVKKGDLTLHTGYFNSLKSVNPRVKGYARIADIISLQKDIAQTCRDIFNQVKKSDGFNTGEVDYVSRVLTELLEKCSTATDELMAVVTDGKMEMKDDERIRRIDRIYNEMTEGAGFIKAFQHGLSMLSLARQKEQNDLQLVKSLIKQ